MKQWIPQLPRDVDLIVGIPRSGLLVANLLALHLNLPLTDIEGLIAGRLLQTGRRLGITKDLVISKPMTALVVDDSTRSGRQLKQVRSKLDSAGLQHQIYYAAVYATTMSYQYVDFWYEILEPPRFFEWNIMHHPLLRKSCVDIDGVLCREPTNHENDDGEEYYRFLTSVPPLTIPTKTIGWLVTCRLEKYRAVTEAWLRQHHVRYKHLMMMDLQNQEAGTALANYAAYKAGVYKSLGAMLFIESSHRQALEIARLSGRSVFCVESAEMVRPGIVSKGYSKAERAVSLLRRSPGKFLVKLAKVSKKKLYRWRHRLLANKHNGRRSW